VPDARRVTRLSESFGGLRSNFNLPSRLDSASLFAYSNAPYTYAQRKISGSTHHHVGPVLLLHAVIVAFSRPIYGALNPTINRVLCQEIDHAFNWALVISFICPSSETSCRWCLPDSLGCSPVQQQTSKRCALLYEAQAYNRQDKEVLDLGPRCQYRVRK
jgi:hypothetical protein